MSAKRAAAAVPSAAMLPAKAAPRSSARVPLFLFGGRGMLGGELARLLEQHPVLALEAIVSRSGGPVGHRQLPGLGAALTHAAALARLTEILSGGERAALVLALPHGEAAALWPALEGELRGSLGGGLERLHLVDLSADFRLRDPALYASAYGRTHPAPEALARFAYGLPELFRTELERAAAAGPARIAAPGCFATALQLATLPAARARIVRADAPWILHAVTGSSGSGIEPKPETHHPHRHGNLWAYALGGHRHEAELSQALAPHVATWGSIPPIHFVPHSGPFARGIHLTAALPLERGVDAERARAVFAEAYAGEPFVEVLAEGVPDLRMVVGSNRAALAVSVRGAVLHVLLALDNLIKGGSGQALQCLNLALGLEESAGLPRSGMGVC
jgi:N-acetyl-gamma-glutamyl-phosphate reductase